MTEWYWPDVRERAITAFGGELPHPQTEQTIIDAFAARPRSVVGAIAKVAEQVASGQARSGWAVLRSRVQGALVAAPQVSASDESEREHAVARAEAWLRNCGCHIDRESELRDAFFGRYGEIRAWATDESLQQRMAALWRELRLRGEAVERDAEERAAKWRAWRKAKAAAAAQEADAAAMVAVATEQQEAEEELGFDAWVVSL